MFNADMIKVCIIVENIFSFFESKVFVVKVDVRKGQAEFVNSE